MDLTFISATEGLPLTLGRKSWAYIKRAFVPPWLIGERVSIYQS